jgi:hypothetical protein
MDAAFGIQQKAATTWGLLSRVMAASDFRD